MFAEQWLLYLITLHYSRTGLTPVFILQSWYSSDLVNAVDALQV